MSDGASLLPVYRNADKKTHGFCCSSSLYDAIDATEIVNEVLDHRETQLAVVSSCITTKRDRTRLILRNRKASLVPLTS